MNLLVLPQFNARRISQLLITIIVALCVAGSLPDAAYGQFARLPQQVRRNQRKQLNRPTGKVAVPAERQDVAPQDAPKSMPGAPAVDVSRELQKIFTPAERALIIPGYGSPIAQLLINRELGLDEKQRAAFTSLTAEIGPRLVNARKKLADKEIELARTLYGPEFVPSQVERFAAEVAADQTAVLQLQASIETRIYQTLNAEQASLYRLMFEQLVAPPRFRPPLQQLMPRQVLTTLLNRFTAQERAVIIRGLGNPLALVLIFRSINLTEQQRREMFRLNRETGNELIRLRRERDEAERELEATRVRESEGDKKLEELQAQIASHQSALTIKQASIESQIRQILTPEQWAMYREMLRGLATQLPFRPRR